MNFEREFSLKESNFEKSYIDNENESLMEKSRSEKVSFLDNSKSKSNKIRYSKEKNESFKEYSSRNSSGKINSLKNFDFENQIQGKKRRNTNNKVPRNQTS